MNLRLWHRSALSRLGKELWRDTDAAALVEATVLTPVLVILFFGVFEFSHYFYNQQAVEIGVRDAARYLARGPYFTTAVKEDADPCLDSTNTTAAQNLAVYGNIGGSGAPRVPGWTIGSVSISCPPVSNTATPPAYAGPSTIHLVTVSTTFPDPALGFFGMLGLGTPTLSASHTQRFFGAG
jgi:hypothetical protein